MSDSSIQLPAFSAGDRMATDDTQQGGSTVHRVRVFRPPVLVLKSGVAGSPGWVNSSGNPAGSAGNATVTSVIDLGVDFHQYGLLQIALKRSQALASANVYGSDDGNTNAQPLCATTGSILALSMTAAGDVVATALPSGRYVRIVTVNGVTAQDGTAVDRVTALPA